MVGLQRFRGVDMIPSLFWVLKVLSLQEDTIHSTLPLVVMQEVPFGHQPPNLAKATQAPQHHDRIWASFRMQHSWFKEATLMLKGNRTVPFLNLSNSRHHRSTFLPKSLEPRGYFMGLYPALKEVTNLYPLA